MENKISYKEYTVEGFIEDDNFRKWIFSPDEMNQFFWEDFQKKNPEKTETIQTAKQILEVLAFEEKPVKREEYLKSLDALKIRAGNTRQRQDALSFIPKWWSRIAAVLLLPVIAFSVYFYLSDNETAVDETQVVEYIVPNGQKSKVILADGTDVWLNSGSKLICPVNNNSGKRIVSLEGEGFFRVAEKKGAPFLVKTKDYTVKVYGTRFNVRAYPGQEHSETILEEGAISILTSDEQELKLIPGQRFRLFENNKYQISPVNTDFYTCWKNNILKVDNERLENLITRMERWYGVNIDVTNFEKVKDIRYTLTIKTESLREMLELMKYVTPFTYKIEGENVTLNFNL